MIWLKRDLPDGGTHRISSMRRAVFPILRWRRAPVSGRTSSASCISPFRRFSEQSRAARCHRRAGGDEREAARPTSKEERPACFRRIGAATPRAEKHAGPVEGPERSPLVPQWPI
jgi:hypothetical protein